MEAGGLAKADRFGLSDPYVVIRANGQTQVRFGCCSGKRNKVENEAERPVHCNSSPQGFSHLS